MTVVHVVAQRRGQTLGLSLCKELLWGILPNTRALWNLCNAPIPVNLEPATLFVYVSVVNF